MPDTYKLDLAKPIQAHGETLSSLTLRKPTVQELRRCGAPYKINASAAGALTPDYEACARLISVVCAIPPSSVDQMDGADFDEAAVILVGFTKRAPLEASGAGSASTS